MKKIILSIFVLTCAVALSACTNVPNPFDFMCENGSGNVIMEARTAADFDSIHLMVPANVYIAQGESDVLRIEGDDNLLELINVDVDGTALEIDLDKTIECINPTQEINIWVTMENVNELVISGSGAIESETLLTTENLILEVNGSGEIVLDLNAQQVKTDIDGSGKINLMGTAKTHNFDIDGSGSLEAFDLQTEITTIDISGSGKARVNASQELDVKISGSGNVKYKGDAQKVNQKVSGSGLIEKVE